MVYNKLKRNQIILRLQCESITTIVNTVIATKLTLRGTIFANSQRFTNETGAFSNNIADTQAGTAT